MTIEKKYIDQLINVTSQAAVASFFLIGKKDKTAADQAAVDAMRTELNQIDMIGEIVIGEGTLDEAPMLYNGEILGNKNGPNFDIAVDPVEGTNFVANNLPGALSVIAIAEKGNLFKAPETYMEKIATTKAEKGLIDLDYSIKKNITNLADFKNTSPSNLTACVLDRPRHKKIIDELSALKVKIKLITDGDVAGALLVTNAKYGIDIFLGIGGGPEGVLAAAALDAFDCHFQGRFIFDNEKDIQEAKSNGIEDLNKKYELIEIVKGESIFCATAITDTMNMKGVISEGNSSFVTETLVTHKSLNNKYFDIKKNKLLLKHK
ncbi:class II fructose-bisphosphatase [Pelagibacterales bacterium SAG-MED19]|nr:class II fructose-bisphosphatase [Pelagibacterales bacterium SAG-MED19]